MKLVKINNVRVGQIWTFNEGQTYDLVIDVRNIDPNFRDCLYEVNYIIYGDLEYNIGYKKEKGDNYFIDVEYCRRDEPASNDILEKFKDMKNLVGFLGITHKIEDGKLVEIPREIYNIDDVLKTDFLQANNTILKKEQVVVGIMFDCFMNCYRIYTIYTINDSIRTNLIKTTNSNVEKIGILGVNYEFVNNKLGK